MIFISIYRARSSLIIVSFSWSVLGCSSLTLPPPSPSSHQSAALSFFLEWKWIDTLRWQASAQDSLWLQRQLASRERVAGEKLTSWERNQSSSTYSLSNWADKLLAGIRDQQNLWQELVGSINSWQQALPFVSHWSQDIMTLKCLCWVIAPMAICPGHYEAILIFLLRKIFKNC